MRFEFTRSDDSQGLPVIPVVPDHRLSTIEGRNGIGKTLAARLLELVTGGQPFAALPKAWASLCSDLGRLTITIHGLPDQQVVRCELDGNAWKGRTEDDCAADPGPVFINDQPVAWEEVRRLIKVRRIAGDEGLAETLGRTLRESSLVASVHGTEASEFVERLGVDIEELTNDTGHVTVSTFRQKAAQLRQASNELQTSQADMEAARALHEQRDDARSFHEAAAKSLRKLPDQLEAYAQALEQYRQADERVRVADQQLTYLGRQQALDAEKQARIDQLVGRLLPYRMRQLAAAKADEKRTTLRLGLEGRVTSTEIRDRQREIASHIEELGSQNRTDFMAETVRQVQNEIERELRAMPKTAQQQHIATVGREIRVHELAEGIALRRRELEGVPKPSVVSGRERTIAQLNVEQSLLRQLRVLYQATDRKQELVNLATVELDELTSAGDASGAAGNASQLAPQARAELLTASVFLREVQGAIETLIGDEPTPSAFDGDNGAASLAETEDASEEEDEAEGDASDISAPLGTSEVAARVDAWLRTLEAQLDDRSRGEWVLPADREDSLIERLQSGTETVDQVVGLLQNEEREADQDRQLATRTYEVTADKHRRAEEEAGIQLEQLWAAMRSLSDPVGAWSAHHTAIQQVMRRFGVDEAGLADLSDRTALLSDLLDEQSAAVTRLEAACWAVETINQIVSELESSASRVRDSWAIAVTYLHKFSSDLAPRLDSSPFDVTSMRASAGDALSRWAGESLSSLLASDELRAELFDGSESVSFNISDLTVSWVDQEGRRKRRPIEAFSSGEQVFAYTRAKLERLRTLQSSTTCVVVFLDEFGAFVARDRFAQLMSYIEHDALGSIADQIVVTVPLSAEIDRVVENAAIAKVAAEKFDRPGYVVVPSRTA